MRWPSQLCTAALCSYSLVVAYLQAAALAVMLVLEAALQLHPLALGRAGRRLGVRRVCTRGSAQQTSAAWSRPRSHVPILEADGTHADTQAARRTTSRGAGLAVPGAASKCRLSDATRSFNELFENLKCSDIIFTSLPGAASKMKPRGGPSGRKGTGSVVFAALARRCASASAAACAASASAAACTLPRSTAGALGGRGSACDARLQVLRVTP